MPTNGRLIASATLSALLGLCPAAGAAGPESIRTVVVLTPENAAGSPAGMLINQGLRTTFAAGSSQHIEIRNEYLDLSRFEEPHHQTLLVELLRQKYAGQNVDLVMTALGSALDFALAHRAEIFPRVPVVFIAVDQAELQTRALPADVVGVPITRDLVGTLDLSLRLHPKTRRVFVITGSSGFDVYWEGVARRAFAPYEDRLEFVYLSGLPMSDLVKRVANLPDGSVIHYVHVFQDGSGKTFIPANALKAFAAAANAPIYGHRDSHVGHGIVGGRVTSFELEGKHAAMLGLRILAGERPETMSRPDVSPNVYMFDWRQLRRWGISEASLPPGSELRFREPGAWHLYRWYIVGAISLFVLQAALIVALVAQMASRRRADEGLRRSQNELRILTGRLLQARESEARRVARELHDDLGQGLALLTVELDLLRQGPPEASDQLGGRVETVLARVKQLSSSVHDLSHQLHPSKLEQLGLEAAIGSLCRELADTHDLKIDFTHDQMPPAISADTAVCLYRIVQEGLSNAIRHGGARQAEVELKSTGQSISLRIVDYGDGFDPRHVQDKSGLGLVSMRERVLHLGGEITIDSQPSRGTRLCVRVPLRDVALA